MMPEETDEEEFWDDSVEEDWNEDGELTSPDGTPGEELEDNFREE